LFFGKVNLKRLKFRDKGLSQPLFIARSPGLYVLHRGAVKVAANLPQNPP